MNNSLYAKDIISIRDLTYQQIEAIMADASYFKTNRSSNCLKNKIVAQCFFEPSTRTRLSFEAATLKLGGQNIGFSDSGNLSIKKGETLADTIQMLSYYSDAIIIRHPQEGSARLAAEISANPVVNAGDGANQHPTQALVDLFSLKECFSELKDLHVVFVGDLKYGRTAHSLIELLSLYDCRLYFVAENTLQPPDEIFDLLKQRTVKFSCHQSLSEIIIKIDVIYMTRVQRERMLNRQEFKDYQLSLELLREAKPQLRILHPLPRNQEIPKEIDKTKHAYYFQQAQNGLFIRQSILRLLLCDNLTEGT